MPNSKVVRIDEELYRRIEKVRRKDSNKYKYTSPKQFVDVAVLDLLEREEKK